MKLSWFVAILVPGVSAFVVPSSFLGATCGLKTKNGVISRSAVHANSAWGGMVSMTAAKQEDEPAWNIYKFFEGMLGTAPEAKSKADTTASEVYAELRKKVLMKQERQCLEGQLCSLLRIGGDTMSTKSEEHVRRLVRELEKLQPNANAFGLDTVSLAGSWKLLYTSAGGDGRSSKNAEKLCSVEHISYVSENYRILHTDSGVLKVYKRVSAKPKSSSLNSLEDDTATGCLVGAVVRGKGAAGKRASARVGGTKQPIRKRIFFGWRR